MENLSKRLKQAAACAVIGLTLLKLNVWNNGGTINVVPVEVYVFPQQLQRHSTTATNPMRQTHASRCYWTTPEYDRNQRTAF
ncbi:MAG TPA: hypothetical protein VGP76_19370 [Planctomycetaceae bacterium]|jgi:hypothetical protein|nr:hypothetical protein [Planctomycetaceae bacterium]